MSIGIELTKIGFNFFAAIIKPRENVVVFHSYPDISDNSFALYEHALTIESATACKMFWLVSKIEGSRKTLESKLGTRLPENTFIRKKNSLRGLHAYISAKYVFHTHGVFSFARKRRGQTIVNLWHGMPIKKIGLCDNKSVKQLPVSDYTIATSPLFAKIMSKALNVPIEKVLVTGLPRNDIFADVAPKSDEGLFAVWMPTYRASNTGDVRSDVVGARFQISNEVLHALDWSLSSTKVRLVLKLHPMDVLNCYAWDTFRNIEIWSNGPELESALDLYNYLSSAICLITDFSSVAIDFLLTGRPVGIFAPDVSDYQRGFFKSASDVLAQCTSTIPSLTDIPDFLRLAFSGEFRRVDVLTDVHTFTDGGASKRIIDALTPWSVS